MTIPDGTLESFMLQRLVEALEHHPSILARLGRLAALAANDPTLGMVDQASSPLGRRTHRTEVRRLVAEGIDGAAIVGRRHLLRRDLVEAALRRLGSDALARYEARKGTASPDSNPTDDADLGDILADLGLERVK
jgi:hypothetical protein